ncbi:Serine/Threonine kinase domain protein (macronuclear) [Tetrahymena thermophila SB210]|uniref:Serine/Threonine kinase domain protein n=1 Tax=Tetrahymena thermophila (strain SB210) TaxID=312017 RepID=Q229Y6_TETTS|nr:Serine/Threonine kinase domain protein [Tetrahymena thermophila SB210]EAR82101.1 Serine/Threonine kinase domain protein [Tetrahymena thermophila SB210]|eukprot:XP_001029764.1 Serine/Threonine kinase domain protein [Tetrahymena thermophila SB210]
MDKYQISLQAHDNLYIVLNDQGKKLAMKKLKRGNTFADLEEAKNDIEVRHLNKLKNEHVIEVLDVIYNSTDRTGFIILPYFQMNLFEFLENGKKLQEFQRRHIVKQLFQVLSFIHSQNIFHRDLHPENIMITDEQEYSSDKSLFNIKLIDFGSSKCRQDNQFTDYVGVRWYRAPELLLSCQKYDEKVDIFALGCIIYEIYHKKPLFPGTSELAQLNELCVILGSPTQEIWSKGVEQAEKKGLDLGKHKKSNLKVIFCDMPQDMVELCELCLTWNPEKRISAAEALNHKSIINSI